VAKRVGKAVLQTLLAVLFLTGGSEAYLRFSEMAFAKWAGATAACLGIVLLGLIRPTRWMLALGAAAIVVVAVYLAQATLRFPGLLKEPPPHDLIDVASWCGKVVLLIAAGILASRVTITLAKALIARDRFQ